MKNGCKSLLFGLISIVCIFSPQEIDSQENRIEPFVGAQVYVEPGHTAENFDHWFRIMKEQNLSVCRIRLMESYMHKPDGSWDFTLFDHAFKAADKYGIRVFADIFPLTEKTNLGGLKSPGDEAHLQSIAECIRNMVIHFREYNCFYAWMLCNEPGINGISGDFARKMFSEWKKSNPQKDLSEKGYPILADFSQQSFLLYYNTWYMNWIADEIKKYDTSHEIHVNPHALFTQYSIYDFPAWRKFLTILGGSTHAAWHFGYFNRDKYAVAMSASCEILRSGAGNIPWMVTEMQGGNNLYSGNNPLCPTAEEIAQWLWITVGSGGKGAIFWTLNPTISISEAGEWGMLNYQYQPTDRLVAAGKVAATLIKHKDLFSAAKESEPCISILYVHESQWVESIKAKGSSDSDFEARQPGAVMKSALAWFEAAGETGINVAMQAISEYDFSKEDYSGKTIILSHQICIPYIYIAKLEDFVSKGGKLIVDGLTGYYDENIQCMLNSGWPFEKLMGGNISEFKASENIFYTTIGDLRLPSHYMKGFISNKSAKIISSEKGLATAVKNSFGKGEVLWIPSMTGLGCRIEGDFSPLEKLLYMEASSSLDQAPFRFRKAYKSMIMKTLQSGDSFITIIVNKSALEKNVELVRQNTGLKPVMIYCSNGGSISGNIVKIAPEEIVVAKWE